MGNLKKVLIIILIVIIVSYIIFLSTSFILWCGRTLKKSNQDTGNEVDKLLEMDEIYRKTN